MALRFDIDKLRPWEFWGWESDECYLVTTLTNEFRQLHSQERDAARRDAERVAAMKGGTRG